MARFLDKTTNLLDMFIVVSLHSDESEYQQP